MSSKLFNLKLLADESRGNVTNATEPEEPPKKKRGRPRKDQTQETEKAENLTVVSRGTTSVNNNLPLCQTNEPYEDTYDETNNMLKVSIAQLDTLACDVKSEIDSIRGSKTLKGKYKYISDLCSTASNIVSSKISAIKEMNSVKTKCHELEMRRVKDIKSAMANQQDDDKYIADLYHAYVNTPIGQKPLPMQYTSGTIAGNIPAFMGGISTAQENNEDANFQKFMNNLTPEQNRMIIGDNPNVETIIILNPETGERQWDVIDSSTGLSIPNMPRPDKLLLDEANIDTTTGIATNSNIGQSWKVRILDSINHF